MTVLFLFFSLAIGWSAWNLYHPVYRYPLVATASFLTGWLVGELALHHIAWQLAVTALFAWGGAIHGFAGALGLVTCVVSWLAMGYFYLTGERAAGTVQRALTEGLGDDYQETIQDTFRAAFPSAIDRRHLQHPFKPIAPGVEVIKDVPFGHHDQRLDIYRPRRPITSAPVLLQIHGGAWTEKMGDKNHQALPLMSHMAERGWVAVSIDYRLCPGATFPDHIIDCKEGLRWIKQHIASWGGDPDFVVVTGGSAGGHLCALLALSANDPEFQPGFEDLDTSVQGAVPFYGVYDLLDTNGHQHHGAQQALFERSLMKLPRSANKEAYERASPLHRNLATAPPFFVIHGDKDTLVPVEEAREFVARLRAASQSPVSYAEIEGGQHAFDMFASLRSEHTKHGVERFLTWLYSGYLARRG